MDGRVFYCNGDEWNCNWFGGEGIQSSVLEMFNLPYFLDIQINGQVANIFLGLGKITVFLMLFWKLSTKW